MLKETLPSADDLRAKDPARICPMLAGPTLIDGDTLTVRHAQGDIAINADRALLRQVFKLCDGTRPVVELLDGVSNPETRERLGRFIPFLLDSGALVDASRYLLNNMGFAWGNNPYGQAAPDNLSERIGQRFSHETPSQAPRLSPAALERTLDRRPGDALQAAFDARLSTYTFDDAPLPQETLDQMAWSLAGMVCDSRERNGHVVPRRTTPSAGAMHLTDIYVALQRPTRGSAGQALQAGIYRVRYPGAHRVRYEHIGDALALLPRVVAKPWCLARAAGMFFLAADAELAALRYRNRAIQYLYSEAGMALQNGALAASHLNLGFVVFGSYYEPVVRTLCGIPGHLILGAAIFGLPPTAAQQASAAQAPAVDFAWADAPSAEYSLPFYVGRAKLKQGPSDRPTWGRDTDPALAYRKAIAETIERQGYREPRDLLQASWTELSDALDPVLSRGSAPGNTGVRISRACHSMRMHRSAGRRPNALPMAKASPCWPTWCTRRMPCATSTGKPHSIGAAIHRAAPPAPPWPTPAWRASSNSSNATPSCATGSPSSPASAWPSIRCLVYSSAVSRPSV